ncbi:hypothetical protein I309_06642 [Cryptococcus deuterogattii LA55]|nr:hypothetical protein I309_06642 [Cryptococcus deuterogattii LA55]KIR89580.1 hypothetical protein I304_06631 [Cryptococcus deuterogattii CBS 10090]
MNKGRRMGETQIEIWRGIKGYGSSREDKIELSEYE